MSQATPDRVGIAWLLLAGLVFLLVRVPFADVPLERDEGEYAYIGWRLLEGDVPYRDAFDQKPPGAFVAYALSFLLLGESVGAVRWLAALWTAATAVVLFALVRRLAGALAAAGALLCFASLVGHAALGGPTANTECLMLLPMVASLLCALRGLEGPGLRSWLLAGVLAATACAFKQVAFTHAVFLALLAGLAPPPTGAVGGAVRVQRLGALAAGGLAVAGLLVGVFAVAGALREFVDSVWLHNLAYASRRTGVEGAAALRWALARQGPAFVVAWLLATGALAWPGCAPLRVRALLGGWLVASLAGVAVGWQFRPHYFVQALPALASLAGVALAAGWRALAGGRRARGAAVAAALALAVVLPPLLAQRGLLTAGSPQAVARRLWGLNPFPEARVIGDYIARTSQPEETVFVVGSEPQIPFYARRRSATRYIFFYPLTGPYGDAPARQREAVEQMRRARPRYVVWTQVPTSLLLDEGTEQTVFDETRAALRESYRLEFVVRPDSKGRGYEFVHGEQASGWMVREADRLGELPWLAVYRRAH